MYTLSTAHTKLWPCGQTATRSPGLLFNHGLHPSNTWNYMDYYSFADPEEMEGWVGLVGWLTLYPQNGHVSAIKRSSGKVRQPKTDALNTERLIDWIHLLGCIATQTWLVREVAKHPSSMRRQGTMDCCSRSHCSQEFQQSATSEHRTTDEETCICTASSVFCWRHRPCNTPATSVNITILFEKLITSDNIVLCIIFYWLNDDIQKIFSKYKVLPYESTLSRIKYAVWSTFEKACMQFLYVRAFVFFTALVCFLSFWMYAYCAMCCLSA